MNKVLITGGSGLVGRRLIKKLLEKGYRVSVLSRKKRSLPGISVHTWDIEKGRIDAAAFKDVDAIIHLAGANIGEKRWTNHRKEEILNSRVKSTQFLFKHIKEQEKKPKTFISASAIGYYGALTSDKIFQESDPPADDFLGRVCHAWEETADLFTQLDIRTVKLRTGVVLTPEGGALSKMITPVKWGVGAAIGSGGQYLPWVHIDDLTEMYIRALEDSNISGTYNAVAPDYKTNKAFTEVLAPVLQKPLWLPNIPSFFMKMLFGEMAGLFLKGSRVSAEKILKTGFSFNFPKLESALADLLKTSK